MLYNCCSSIVVKNCTWIAQKAMLFPIVIILPCKTSLNMIIVVYQVTETVRILLLRMHQNHSNCLLISMLWQTCLISLNNTIYKLYIHINNSFILPTERERKKNKNRLLNNRVTLSILPWWMYFINTQSKAFYKSTKKKQYIYFNDPMLKVEAACSCHLVGGRIPNHNAVKVLGGGGSYTDYCTYCGLQIVPWIDHPNSWMWTQADPY